MDSGVALFPDRFYVTYLIAVGVNFYNGGSFGVPYEQLDINPFLVLIDVGVVLLPVRCYVTYFIGFENIVGMVSL